MHFDNRSENPIRTSLKSPMTTDKQFSDWTRASISSQSLFFLFIARGGIYYNEKTITVNGEPFSRESKKSVTNNGWCHMKLGCVAYGNNSSRFTICLIQCIIKCRMTPHGLAKDRLSSFDIDSCNPKKWILFSRHSLLTQLRLWSSPNPLIFKDRIFIDWNLLSNPVPSTWATSFSFPTMLNPRALPTSMVLLTSNDSVSESLMGWERIRWLQRPIRDRESDMASGEEKMLVWKLERTCLVSDLELMKR